MIKVKRDGQEMNFDDHIELLVFAVENMSFKSELEEVKVKLESMDKRLMRVEKAVTEDIPGKIAAVKYDTAKLLKNKQIITKQEGLEYIRGAV